MLNAAMLWGQRADEAQKLTQKVLGAWLDNGSSPKPHQPSLSYRLLSPSSLDFIFS